MSYHGNDLESTGLSNAKRVDELGGADAILSSTGVLDFLGGGVGSRGVSVI